MVSLDLLDQLAADADRDNIQQIVVGAVIAANGKVLLLRRPRGEFMEGIFELPSGKVEDGESLGDALARETKEETGLEVMVIQQYLGRFDYPSSSGTSSRQLNFSVEVNGLEPIELQEHDAYYWAPLNEELPVTNAVKNVLSAYNKLNTSHGHADPGRTGY